MIQKISLKSFEHRKTKEPLRDLSSQSFLLFIRQFRLLSGKLKLFESRPTKQSWTRRVLKGRKWQGHAFCIAWPSHSLNCFIVPSHFVAVPLSSWSFPALLILCSLCVHTSMRVCRLHSCVARGEPCTITICSYFTLIALLVRVWVALLFQISCGKFDGHI